MRLICYNFFVPPKMLTLSIKVSLTFLEFIEHCVLNRNANPLSSTPLACLKLDEMHCLMGHAITSCCIDFYHNR